MLEYKYNSHKFPIQQKNLPGTNINRRRGTENDKQNSMKHEINNLYFDLICMMLFRAITFNDRFGSPSLLSSNSIRIYSV